MSFTTSLTVLLPEIIMAIGAMVLLLAGAAGGEKTATPISWAAIGVMVLAELAVAMGTGGPAFGGAFMADNFARYAKLLILISAALSVLLTEEFFANTKQSRFELPVLILLPILYFVVFKPF